VGERAADPLARGRLVDLERGGDVAVAEVRDVAQHQRLALARSQLVERAADRAGALPAGERVTGLEVVGDRGALQDVAAAPPRLQHVDADVARDPAQPRLHAALTAVRRHAAVCSEQRLLGGLVGVGLRAEQRHAQPAQHVTVRAGTRRDRVAVPAAPDQRGDLRSLRGRRVRAGEVERSGDMHVGRHVRRGRHFVTGDRR
jgi:hypothetical protein